MRGMGIVVAMALSLPLGGCFSAILPPKELPDWAMSPQRADAPTRVRIKTVRHMRGAPDRTADISFVRPMADVKPFSAEWQARENAFDEKLRRSMNICGSC
jgi:hypothetical protein